MDRDGIANIRVCLPFRGGVLVQLGGTMLVFELLISKSLVITVIKKYDHNNKKSMEQCQ